MRPCFLVSLQLWCDSSEIHINNSDSLLAPPTSTWADINICKHPEVSVNTQTIRQLINLIISLLYIYYDTRLLMNNCPCLQYMVLSGVVAMVTCAVFLRLSCVLKLAVLLLAAALYTYLIETQR